MDDCDTIEGVVRAVLFDYGLTLVTFAYPREELIRMLDGVRPLLGPNMPDAETLVRDVLEPLEDLLDTFGEDEVDYLDLYERAWRAAGVEASRETLYRVLDLEQQVWDRHVRLADGALPTLDAVRMIGVRTAVASNAPFPPEFMHRQLRGNGIADRVDAIVFSSEIGRRKPAPELYMAALDRLGVAPAEALYVGDRVSEDYEGPRQLGMRAVICTELARRPVPAGVPTIDRLDELVGLLERAA
jgi:HAD superfamily hydrolase (TIGR01509 family)